MAEQENLWLLAQVAFQTCLDLKFTIESPNKFHCYIHCCGKVMFSQACVIPSVHRGCIPQHAMGQGVCIPACNGGSDQGGVWPGRVSTTPRKTATKAGGTHPTGMLSFCGDFCMTCHLNSRKISQPPFLFYNTIGNCLKLGKFGTWSKYWNVNTTNLMLISHINAMIPKCKLCKLRFFVENGKHFCIS